jgi:hypothetical protein
MNRSRWAAAGFVLATMVVCYFGVRAELAQAQLSTAQRAARVATAVSADNASALVAEIDPSSAVRGSLGASLDDFSLGNHLGALTFVLNGGFALLCGAFAVIVVARRRQNRKRLMESPREPRATASFATTTGEHFLR